MATRIPVRSVRGLAIAVAAIASVATLAIGAFAWFVVHEEIEWQIAHRIELEVASLEEVYRTEGFDRLRQVVEARDLRIRVGDSGYLDHVANDRRAMGYIVTDALGRRQAGRLQAKLPPSGWSEVVPFQRPDGSEGIAQAMNVPLLGQGRLVVAADRAIVDEIDFALVKVFLAVLGLMLLILALTVIGFGHIVHLRLSAIRDSARAIMAGDLARRMPYVRENSEFDQLAVELNRMLDRIEALMDALQQVSTDVAHDLRTPLMRLRADLETALMAEEIDLMRSAVQGAMTEAEEALELFAGILAISEVEGQSARARFAPLNLTDAIARLAEAYEPSLKDAGVRLELDLQEAWVLGDRSLLQRAVANLLDNLIAHTRHGVTGRLTILALDERVVIALSDDGPGVAVGAEGRIFERFVRLDRDRSRPGYGLGLALVAAVARAHGGVASARRLGTGLTVEINLPGHHKT